MQGAPVCRWVVGGVILDVMPTAESVLGFANRWYPLAVLHSQRRKVGRHYIRLVSPPLFLATKLEAFDGRGRGDYRASHDSNDIIAVVDGRRELVAEVTASPVEIRAYLAQRIGRLHDAPLFIEAIPGHLPGDEASQARTPVIVARLRQFAGRASS